MNPTENTIFYLEIFFSIIAGLSGVLAIFLETKDNKTLFGIKPKGWFLMAGLILGTAGNIILQKLKHTNEINRLTENREDERKYRAKTDSVYEKNFALLTNIIQKNENVITSQNILFDLQKSNLDSTKLILALQKVNVSSLEENVNQTKKINIPLEPIMCRIYFEVDTNVLDDFYASKRLEQAVKIKKSPPSVHFQGNFSAPVRSDSSNLTDNYVNGKIETYSLADPILNDILDGTITRLFKFYFYVIEDSIYSEIKKYRNSGEVEFIATNNSVLTMKSETLFFKDSVTIHMVRANYYLNKELNKIGIELYFSPLIMKKQLSINSFYDLKNKSLICNIFHYPSASMTMKGFSMSLNDDKKLFIDNPIEILTDTGYAFGIQNMKINY